MHNSYAVNDKYRNEDGAVCTILFITANSVLIEEVLPEGGTQEITLAKKAFEEIFQKSHHMLKRDNALDLPLKPFQQEICEFRLGYMNMLKVLVDEGHKPTVIETYKLLIARVEEEKPQQRQQHPSLSSICRYWKMWRGANYHTRALAPSLRNKTNLSTLSPASIAQLDHVVRTVFVQGKSSNVSSCYKVYRNKVSELAGNNPTIEAVSLSSFQRRIANVNNLEKKLNNKHLSQAERNQLLLAAEEQMATHYNLERVECDAMHLNMCLHNEVTGKPTAPMRLYIAQDTYSRIPVAMVLGFGSENKEDVLNLLRNMYIKKDNSPAYGKPTTLVMDNGPAFANDLVKNFCEKTESTLIYSPSNQPTTKPFVERFIGTLRRQFFESAYIEANDKTHEFGFTSYAGKRTKKDQAGVSDIAKISNITINDMVRLLGEYVTEYIHTKHKELGKTPFECWQKSANTMPRPLYDYQQLKSCFHLAVNEHGQNVNKLQSNGMVHCLNQRFSSKASKDLHDRLATFSIKDDRPSVTVLYDPWDCSAVTLLAQDPRTGESIHAIVDNYSMPNDQPMMSFDERNDKQSKSMSVLNGKPYAPIGCNMFYIEQFKNQTTNRVRASKPIQCFEDNNLGNVSVESRIENANTLHGTQSAQVINETVMPAQKKRVRNKRIPNVANAPDMPAMDLPLDDEDKMLWNAV